MINVNELAEDPTQIKPPKRKYKKRRKRRARPVATVAAKPQGDKFAGLGVQPTECCNICFVNKRCVITDEGSGACGHPNGAGLRASDKLIASCVRNYAICEGRIDAMIAERKSKGR